MATSAVEVGQGMITILGQIARTVIGIEEVEIRFVDTSQIGSAGSTSASRQTQMAGGAVLAAAEGALARALEQGGGDRLTDAGVWRGDEFVMSLAQLCADGPIEHQVRFRHGGTEEADEYGQGKVHVDFAVSAHRAVVEVDPELGLVRIVRMDTAQDVGRALNPQSIIGQIEGGTMQGIGLAIMEGLKFERGRVLNASFTDYLLPTFADAPPVEAVIVEDPGTWGPFGAKGFAELPNISSVPAVVAAIRDAVGKDFTKVPVLPEDIVDLA